MTPYAYYSKCLFLLSLALQSVSLCFHKCLDVKDERPVPDINYGIFQASHPEIWETCTGEYSHPFAKESLGVFRQLIQVCIALLQAIVFAQKSLALFARNTFLVKKQASLTSVGASSPLLSPPSRWLCAAHHSISSRSPPVASDTARGVILSSRLALIRSLPLPCGQEDGSPSVSGAFLCFLALTLPVLLLPIRHEQHQHPGSALLASPP